MLIFPLKECSPVTAPVLALVENTGSVILWNTLLCKKYSQKSEQKQKMQIFWTDVGFQKSDVRIPGFDVEMGFDLFLHLS